MTRPGPRSVGRGCGLTAGGGFERVVRSKPVDCVSGLRASTFLRVRREGALAHVRREGALAQAGELLAWPVGALRIPTAVRQPDDVAPAIEQAATMRLAR